MLKLGPTAVKGYIQFGRNEKSLNSCCTPNLERATAYCASALLIKLMQDGMHEHQTLLLASIVAIKTYM